MSDTVTAEYFTDPFSHRCWAAEPIVRRLAYEYEAVRWVPRLVPLFSEHATADVGATDDGSASGGAADASESSESSESGVPEQSRGDTAEHETTTDDAGDTAGERAAADLTVEELNRRVHTVCEEHGMPVAPNPWPTESSSTSRVACEAVAAVRERSLPAARALLRQLRLRLFVAGTPPTDAADLVAVAAAVDGVDVTDLERDLADGTAREALLTDLERASETARLAGRVDTRGDVRTLPLAPRLRDVGVEVEVEPVDQPGTTSDAAEDLRRDAAGNHRTQTGVPGEVDAGVGDDHSVSDHSTSDREAATVDENGSPPDRLVVAPPTIRFEADDRTVVAVPTAGYQDCKDAINKLDADIRNTAAIHAPVGTKEFVGRGLSDELAERFTDIDHGARIERYLDRMGPSTLREIAFGVDASEMTTRLTLHELRGSGAVAAQTTNEIDVWRTVGDG